MTSLKLMDQIKLLESTNSTLRRNELALDLAATGDPRVLQALVRLIRRPELRDARGTLVHCLENFDPSAIFELLIELAIDGNWEVAHEAVQLLETVESIEGDVVSRAKRAVQDAQLQPMPPWHRALLDEIEAMFSGDGCD